MDWLKNTTDTTLFKKNEVSYFRQVNGSQDLSYPDPDKHCWGLSGLGNI